MWEGARRTSCDWPCHGSCQRPTRISPGDEWSRLKGPAQPPKIKQLSLSLQAVPPGVRRLQNASNGAAHSTITQCRYAHLHLQLARLTDRLDARRHGSLSTTALGWRDGKCVCVTHEPCQTLSFDRAPSPRAIQTNDCAGITLAKNPLRENPGQRESIRRARQNGLQLPIGSHAASTRCKSRSHSPPGVAAV